MPLVPHRNVRLVTDSNGNLNVAEENGIEEPLSTFLSTSESVSTVGSAGSAQNIAVPSSGKATFDVTASAASCALTFSGAQAGILAQVTLVLRQDGTGGRAWTFPTNVYWPNGQIPAFTVQPGRYDVVVLFSTNGGTTWTASLGSTNAGPITVPSQPTLSILAAGGANVLSWSAPAPGGGPITGYLLQRSTTTGTETTYQTLAAGATSYTDTGVTGGTTYFYKLIAQNAGGNSVASAEVSATPLTAARPGSAPATSAQPVMWLRGDQVGGLTDGAVLASWPDQSGTGNNATQATVAQRPLVKANAIGAQPGVIFSAANSQHLISSVGATPDTKTVLLVFTPNAPGTNANPITGVTSETSSAGNGNNSLFIQANATNKLEVDRGFVAALATSADAVNAGVPYVIGVSVDTSANSHQTKVTVNGGTLTTNTPAGYTATSFPTMGIGGVPNSAPPGGGSFFDGVICEVIVFNATLSDADRKAWTQYLGSTYGIAQGAN